MYDEFGGSALFQIQTAFRNGKVVEETLVARFVGHSEDEAIAELSTLVTDFVAGLFAESIIDIVQTVDRQHIPSMIAAISPAMLNSNFKPDTWLKFEPRKHEKFLMLLFEQNRDSAEALLDMFFPRKFQDLLILDATERGALSLIYTLTFLPDFIITDGLHMVGMNGVTLLNCLQLWDKTRNIPYSFVTANWVSDVDKNLVATARHWLSKPFVPMEYTAMISDHIHEALERKTG